MRSWLSAVCVALALAAAVGVPIAQADSIFARKQVVFDEELAISNSGFQMRGFTVSRGATLEVDVKGVKNTDKGFDCYLMTQANYALFEKHKEFRHFPDFEGLKITGAIKTHDIPAGAYALVIVNKYNLMRGMVVHAKVTVDP